MSILGIVLCCLIPITVFSWLPPLLVQPTGIKNGRLLDQTESLSSSFSSSLLYQRKQHHRYNIRSVLFSSTTTSLEEEECDDEDENVERPPEDYTGKTIFQRTFYRLSPDSQLQLPNSIMLEERLRFQPDANNEGYILPIGPRYVQIVIKWLLLLLLFVFFPILKIPLSHNNNFLLSLFIILRSIEH